jgi:hypothetical protein
MFDFFGWEWRLKRDGGNNQPSQNQMAGASNIRSSSFSFAWDLKIWNTQIYIIYHIYRDINTTQIFTIFFYYKCTQGDIYIPLIWMLVVHINFIRTAASMGITRQCIIGVPLTLLVLVTTCIFRQSRPMYSLRS